MRIKNFFRNPTLLSAIGFASACSSVPEKESLHLTGIVESIDVLNSSDTKLGFSIILKDDRDHGCNDNGSLNPLIFKYGGPNMKLIISSFDEMPYFPGVGERVSFEVYKGGFNHQGSFYDLGISVEGRFRAKGGKGICRQI